MPETLGERVARLMDQANLSVRRAAQIMGTADGTVYKLRRNEVDDMMARSALRLARALGVSPYYLLGEREPTKSPDGSLVADPQIESESEMESLGRAMGELQAAVEAIPDALAQIQARLEKLENESAAKPRQRKHAAG